MRLGQMLRCDGRPTKIEIEATARARIWSPDHLKSDPRDTVEDWLMEARQMPKQAAKIERHARKAGFPDVTFILIGANDMNWGDQLYRRHWDAEAGRQPSSNQLALIADDLVAKYKAQVSGLVTAAKSLGKGEALIVVFGLIDFKSYFEARDIMEQNRRTCVAAGRKVCPYPYMDAAAKYNESLRPENRDSLIALAEMFNERLKSAEALSDGDIRVQFSDAFTRIPISDPALYSLEDAEHPNRAGHELFARTAYRYLTETLAERDAERSMAMAEGRAIDVMSGHFEP